jgi:N-acetyl-1-D-myo-inositol-2-amino-2-deoxy-alpha-D-glucopyranoside deacetylase
VSALEADRRLVLVHAHPDDETINNGASMALYAARGVGITLVTCTRGEMGEVIPAELAHLAADRDDALGPHRVGELAAAMAVLGVRDHRFLGSYRDSGMAYAADGSVVPVPDPRPGAFALVDVDAAAQQLAEIIAAVRPHVVVTYEPGGGYGHPDHVQTHRVTMRAVELAQGEWDVPKVYWNVMPESLVLGAPGAAGAGMAARAGLPSMVVADELVTTVVDGSAQLDAKRAALRAHATQILVDGPMFALSNGVWQPVLGREYYRLVRGETGGPFDGDGRETDLFAGLDG